MTSIFDLNTSVSELSSTNQGTSKLKYAQKQPSRTVVGNNFSNGVINIRFQTGGQEWFVPSRSYIRMRATLRDSLGNPLTVEKGVAPNMGLMSNLFQSAEFRINGVVVSRISDFMAEIDSIETRTTKSKSWMDSLGASINFWSSSTDSRISEVSSDGVEHKGETDDVKTSRVGLGYDAATNTVAVAVDTGVLSFAQNGGTALPANATVWTAGDEIEIDAGGNIGTVRYHVSHIISATTLQLNNVKTIAIPAAGLAFRRIRKVPSESRRVDGFELIWQPPLSIFKVQHALPTGDYELVLNPQSSQSLPLQVVETKAVTVDYAFSVVDFFLYTATVEGPRIDDVTYLLDLEETRLQVDNIDQGGGFQQKNFDVSPSTYALTVAFGDNRCGALTLYSHSKYKINEYPHDPANPGTPNLESKLNRLYINYAGQNKPSPDSDPSYQVGSSEDYTIQRYTETQLHTGSYFDTGGSETIQEWHDRGPYYYWSWPRDGDDRSTRCAVNFGFSEAIQAQPPGGANTSVGRVLLFDHFKKVARVKIANGRVVDVQVEQN